MRRIIIRTHCTSADPAAAAARSCVHGTRRRVCCLSYYLRWPGSVVSVFLGEPASAPL